MANRQAALIVQRTEAPQRAAISSIFYDAKIKNPAFITFGTSVTGTFIDPDFEDNPPGLRTPRRRVHLQVREASMSNPESRALRSQRLG